MWTMKDVKEMKIGDGSGEGKITTKDTKSTKIQKKKSKNLYVS